jgi:hypothetical protein
MAIAFIYSDRFLVNKINTDTDKNFDGDRGSWNVK